MLKLIERTDDWLLLRETRNIVTHEYPFITSEVIDGLNLLYENVKLIIDIFKRMRSFIEKKFDLPK